MPDRRGHGGCSGYSVPPSPTKSSTLAYRAGWDVILPQAAVMRSGRPIGNGRPLIDQSAENVLQLLKWPAGRPSEVSITSAPSSPSTWPLCFRGAVRLTSIWFVGYEIGRREPHLPLNGVNSARSLRRNPSKNSDFNRRAGTAQYAYRCPNLSLCH